MLEGARRRLRVKSVRCYVAAWIILIILFVWMYPWLREAWDVLARAGFIHPRRIMPYRRPLPVVAPYLWSALALFALSLAAAARKAARLEDDERKRRRLGDIIGVYPPPRRMRREWSRCQQLILDVYARLEAERLRWQKLRYSLLNEEQALVRDEQSGDFLDLEEVEGRIRVIEKAIRELKELARHRHFDTPWR